MLVYFALLNVSERNRLGCNYGSLLDGKLPMFMFKARNTSNCNSSLRQCIDEHCPSQLSQDVYLRC